LLEELGTVGVYVHDALHTERSMRSEFGACWTRMVPGGVLIADDVHMNRAFERFSFTGGVAQAFYDQPKAAAVGVAVKAS
jgi:hypothetical protein